MPRPDALMMPEKAKRGARMVDRVASIADVAEPLLGVDRVYIRIQHNTGKLFVSPSIYDTLMFPNDHPGAGQSRYRWEKRADGVELGYLVDGATPGGEPRDQ